MDETVGFIGLGQIGWPIACRILGAKHGLVAHDLSHARRDDLLRLGGEWASSPREIADRADIVFVSLPTPDAVEAVALGPDGLLEGKRMSAYVDLSTTGPLMARRVAERLASRGIDAMDAPVSGGVAGAEAGTLSVMVSGPQAAFAATEALLRCFGANLFYVGAGAGMGQLLKLINNLLSTTALAVTCEALTLGVKAGLDPEAMLSVLKVSSGTNHAVESKLPKYLLAGLPMGFSLGLSYKDVKLCVEAGEAMNVPMQMGRATYQIWHHALCKVGPDQDYLQIARVFEDWAGVRLPIRPDAGAGAIDAPPGAGRVAT